MKVTIVGGSGFVGSRLCQRLNNKNEINFEIIDKLNSHFFPNKVYIADIRFPIDEKFIENSSVIINLAAEHRDNVSPKSLYDETNIQGARNICAVARQKNIQNIIFTSSVAVYGFAPLGTNESGNINPFNDYGRTKWEAEQIYKSWYSEDPENRVLVIVRPTVIFGERNRGNVFNLLRQIYLGRFFMIGNGSNRKSMAYVENVAAFLEYSLSFKPGIHIYNYIDKPDFSMNQLVTHVNQLLSKSSNINIQLPYWLGLLIGNFFDLIAIILNMKFAISAIRIKKFCADSVYESAVTETGFVAPVHLIEAIERTVRYEFIEDHKNEQIFYTE